MLHFKKQTFYWCGIGFAVLGAGALRLGLAVAQETSGASTPMPQLAPLATPTSNLTPTPTPTYVWPKSEGYIAATAQRQVGGQTKIVALSSAYEGHLRPAGFWRLKQYDVRDGQPVIPAQVTSFQKGVFNTEKFTSVSRWRSDGELRLLNGKAYLLLTRIYGFTVELTLYRINPDVPTKASMAAEEREVLRQELKRNQTPLFPGIDTYKVENDPQWTKYVGSGQTEVAPLTVFVKEFSFQDDNSPQKAYIEKLTPQEMVVHVVNGEDNGTLDGFIEDGPTRFRFDFQTKKWSRVPTSKAEMQARERQVGVQEWMSEYRSNRQVLGNSREDAIYSVRQESGIKDWQPLKEAWDTPDFVAKPYPWPTPAPTPTPTPAPVSATPVPLAP